MSNLALVKSDRFGQVQCDFYQDDKETWLTRRQIGEALEYSDPQNAIDVLHKRTKDRLDKFSTTVRLTGVEGGRSVTRNVVVYSPRGVYEICRWSDQPKANAFMDWVYDVLEDLRTGKRQQLATRSLAAAIRDNIEACKAFAEINGMSEKEIALAVIDATERETGKDLTVFRNLVEPTAEVIDQYSPVYQFIFASCALNRRAAISKTDLYEAYSQWAADNNKRPLSRIAFHAELKLCCTGIREIRRGYYVRHWQGITLKDRIVEPIQANEQGSAEDDAVI